MRSLRAIPAVEKLLQALGETGLPRPVMLTVVRRRVAGFRAADSIPAFDSIVSSLREELVALRRSRIQPVVNATGVIIHTNLGRSPLGPPVLETLASIGEGYSILEYDLASGERGNRAGYLEHNLAILCHAEAATVTNNCAAALVLVLRHFTAGVRNEVVISRGELVQIGGGFRIPEILESSGARLREIGATNKTTLADYANAIGPGTALILKVHRSNFFMGGFVESPATEDIAALARKKRVPFVEDLGSGAVVATDKLAGVDHEPTPAEVIKRGVDLVCFSGDKLFGGPQAGLIAGKRKLVEALKRNPLFRAMRCDKLILAALQTTVDLYLEDLAAAGHSALPTLSLLALSNDELKARAGGIAAQLADLPVRVSVGRGKGQLGGGTLPRTVIESVTLDLAPTTMSPADLAARLRLGSPPVVGYISAGHLKLDLRTVFPSQDAQLVLAIRAALVA